MLAAQPREHPLVDPKFLNFDTLSIHAGRHPDTDHGSRTVPIYQTTSYVFRDVDHAAGLFNLERQGHIYSRISNPTVAALEERLAALEGGVGAVAAASGMAALFLAVATLTGSGGHIVSSSSLYGGSNNLLAVTLPRFGIDTTFVHPRDTDGFRRAIRPETRLVFGETLGNPGLEIMDVPAVAEIAHSAGVPLMLDNTFATPSLFRPFEWGVDLVHHSITKFIGGHGAAVGGALIDGGTFDWGASGRFPTLTEPYPSYHGLRFFEEFGPQAFIVRARVEGLRDFGAPLSPQNAFYILQGAETLGVRMRRHVENTREVLRFLAGRDEVTWISHPELEDHPDHRRAAEMMPDGCGAILSFGISGGREAGRRFIERLRVFTHLANVGDTKSLVIHPASTTHATMDDEQLARAGVGEDLIRLSVGLEDPADLIEDLAGALRSSRR